MATTATPRPPAPSWAAVERALPGEGVLVLGRDWVCVYADDVAAQLTERPVDEFLGQSLWALYPEAVGSLFDEQYRWALDHQETVFFEDYLASLERWFAVRAIPAPEGLTLCFTQAPVDRADPDLTRRAVVRAREAEARYRELLDGMFDGVVQTSLAGEILAANRRYAEIFGYETVEAMRSDVRHIEMLYAHPAERLDLLRSIDEGKAPVYEVEVRHRDGSARWLRVNARATRSDAGAINGVHAIVHDVTESRDLERHLEEVAERVDLAFHRNPIPLVVLEVDDDHPPVIVEANRAVGALLGRDPATLVGATPCAEPGEDLDRELDALAEVVAGTVPVATVTSRRRHRDGHEIPVEITFDDFRSASGQCYVVAALEDLTERNRALEALARGLEHTVGALAQVAEVRDPYTSGHQHRVATLAEAIASHLGMTDDEVRGIWTAASIHDIGKVAIPSEILVKPARPTSVEFEIIKTHPQVGYDIVAEIEFPWPVATMILQHHERLDGSGYPDGLRSADILPGSRVIAVADVVEAMCHHRPYRPGHGIAAALEEVVGGRGVRYDADAVDACVAVFADGGFDWGRAPDLSVDSALADAF